ncbi:MAG TPA: ATP-binding protein [Melioribacteraceae bacterium]|nr:ATP-binding protein [Melioribacteraceae bacterium]
MRESFITINADYNQANIVCQNLSNTLNEMNFDTQDIAWCEISLREALNNVIKHAYQDKIENIINITLKIDNNQIVLTITDFGRSRILIKEAVLEFNPNDIENLPENGFGLYIIENVMDFTEYKTNNGKNIYVMMKKLRNKDINE